MFISHRVSTSFRRKWGGRQRAERAFAPTLSREILKTSNRGFDRSAVRAMHDGYVANTTLVASGTEGVSTHVINRPKQVEASFNQNADLIRQQIPTVGQLRCASLILHMDRQPR